MSKDFLNAETAATAENDNFLHAPAALPQGLTATEKHVLEAVCAIFGHDEVSIEENFFDLGGHSIHAARLLTRLRRLQPSLSIRAIFETETLKALAAQIDDFETSSRQDEREEFEF